MNGIGAHIAGIGFWSEGLPSWQAARGYVAGGALVGDAPRRPAPRLLAPNERRRAPESVAVALEVALAACEAAAQDPATLPSVFASGHGDFAITDYMCSTLAEDPRAVSPTRFHNSVHNAAAGYWTIGTGCMATTTAISAGPGTFAEGLIEALAQLADGTPAVLLVAYDTTAVGPLAAMTASRGLLGGALLLLREGPGTRLRATLTDAEAPKGTGALAALRHDNAMAPMLPLFDALAGGGDLALLDAGPGRALRVEIAYG
ncbi:beta-ketoacyl synthase chain length factor [Luteimonas sp. RD2P54]|uniref:Beta-ketoacyl synthase chain length factor n=1 Tax=Luteimonas endophytica TaxID=3042023 RepID=A0ABT6JCF7_9GAMM|nr:beta-ketoacyl synthase chain length factor [Luteimonas endophytica]MDH5824514.1 beta-ketoacyl synthase chain length factor [Luteimonas endophytica]